MLFCVGLDSRLLPVEALVRDYVATLDAPDADKNTLLGYSAPFLTAL